MNEDTFPWLKKSHNIHVKLNINDQFYVRIHRENTEINDSNKWIGNLITLKRYHLKVGKYSIMAADPWFAICLFSWPGKENECQLIFISRYAPEKAEFVHGSHFIWLDQERLYSTNSQQKRKQILQRIPTLDLKRFEKPLEDNGRCLLQQEMEGLASPLWRLFHPPLIQQKFEKFDIEIKP